MPIVSMKMPGSAPPSAPAGGQGSPIMGGYPFPMNGIGTPNWGGMGSPGGSAASPAQGWPTGPGGMATAGPAQQTLSGNPFGNTGSFLPQQAPGSLGLGQMPGVFGASGTRQMGGGTQYGRPGLTMPQPTGTGLRNTSGQMLPNPYAGGSSTSPYQGPGTQPSPFASVNPAMTPGGAQSSYNSFMQQPNGGGTQALRNYMQTGAMPSSGYGGTPNQAQQQFNQTGAYPPWWNQAAGMSQAQYGNANQGAVGAQNFNNWAAAGSPQRNWSQTNIPGTNRTFA